MLKKLDIYIIKKFLGTFFLAILLFTAIIIIIDLTEKIDKIHDHNAPIHAVIFDYYLNIIPYYGNMLSHLFIFIAVIFFTSKLAGNSEIIAMQAGGMSYNRFLRPYFIAASFIAILLFLLSGFVIPGANKTRLNFENQYIKKFRDENVHNVQLEVSKGLVLYIENYDDVTKTGFNVSMDRYDGKKLVSRMTAQRIVWDTLYNWQFQDYLIRNFRGMRESLTRGDSKDTTINVQPKDFFVTAFDAPQMKNNELYNYLERQRERGVGNISAFEDELNKRYSMPFAAFILTIIGAALASRKVRGGVGIHLGFGLLLTFIYYIFSSFTSAFSVNGVIPPLLAAWLPNIAYSLIALYLYKRASK